MWLCGVQMVAMNYQTSDTGLLLNEGQGRPPVIRTKDEVLISASGFCTGLFRNYNGGCGYVLHLGHVAVCCSGGIFVAGGQNAENTAKTENRTSFCGVSLLCAVLERRDCRVLTRP